MNSKKDIEVSIPSAFYLQYREADHVMKVDMDVRDEIPVLSCRSVRKWEPPFAGEPISDSKIKEILTNIIVYLNEVRRFKFEVDGGSFVESREYHN